MSFKNCRVLTTFPTGLILLYHYVPAAAKDTDYAVNGLNQYTDVTVDAVLRGLTYDDNGNLLSDGVWTYTYDVENRLLSATDGVTTATYVYDPLGRRVKKTVNSVDTYYLSDGVEEVLELSSTGAIQNRYVYGPGIDEPILMYAGSGMSSSARHYYRADAQGTIVATIESDGDIRDQYTYDAYGNPEQAAGNAFRYTGRRWDAETGLYYYRARYYSPALGRFLQTDPIGYGDNMNMYAYVGNDPMNLNDPSGKCSNESCPISPFFMTPQQSMEARAAEAETRKFSSQIGFGGLAIFSGVMIGADIALAAITNPIVATEVVADLVFGETLGGAAAGTAVAGFVARNADNLNTATVKELFGEAGFVGRKVSNDAGTDLGVAFDVRGMGDGAGTTFRVMDGGPNHPPRVTSSSMSNPNQKVDFQTGKTFRNESTASERGTGSHIVLCGDVECK